MDPARTGKMPLGRLLLILYAVSLLFSNGPGVLLVNRPVLLLGMPLIYLWAIFWWLVQMSIVLTAYFKVWKTNG